MEAVIKVGGSLAQYPNDLKALCVELAKIAANHSVLVVPGGGKFADIARDFDKKFNLPPAVSHRMAILAMDQYGLLLSHLVPYSRALSALEDFENLSRTKNVTILLPSQQLFKQDPFEASWDVTSDTIAAYFAIKLKANKLILVTDVDGIFTEDPKTHSNALLLSEVSTEELLRRGGRTCVDKFLAKFLSQNQIECFVVNGKHPYRIKGLLAGHSLTSTRIFSSVSNK